MFCSELSDWMPNPQVDDNHWKRMSQTGIAAMQLHIMCSSRLKDEDYFVEQMGFAVEDGVDKFFMRIRTWPLHIYPTMIRIHSKKSTLKMECSFLGMTDRRFGVRPRGIRHSMGGIHLPTHDHTSSHFWMSIRCCEKSPNKTIERIK